MSHIIQSAARSLTGRVLIALMLTVAAQPAISACTKLAYAGIVADVVTTAGAIESGRGEEANPIYPDGDLFYPTLLAVAALRAYAVRYIDDYHTPIPIHLKNERGRITSTVYGLEDRYDSLNCLQAGVALAAAGNNAAIWAGGDDRARIGGAVAGIGIVTLTWQFGAH